MERSLRFLRTSLLSSTTNIKFFKELIGGPKVASTLAEKGIRVKDMKIFDFLGYIRKEETEMGTQYELTERGRPVIEALMDLIEKVNESLPE